MSDWPEGMGIVRKIGWEKVRGKEVFRAIVDFPNGPPSLHYVTIWDRHPVELKEYEPPK